MKRLLVGKPITSRGVRYDELGFSQFSGYPCRFESCPRIFRLSGLRRGHERKRHGLIFREGSFDALLGHLTYSEKRRAYSVRRWRERWAALAGAR